MSVSIVATTSATTMANITDLQKAADSLRPIKLPLSLRMTKVVGGVVLFALIGAFTQLRSDPIFAVIGIPPLALALCAILKMWRHPGETSLLLDAEGVAHSVFSKKVNIRWSEIRNISAGWPEYLLYEVPWNKQVVIHYRRDNKDKRFIMAPRMFGVSAEKLVRLMEPYFRSGRNLSPIEDVKFEAVA
jgi:hypothetical protein